MIKVAVSRRSLLPPTSRGENEERDCTSLGRAEWSRFIPVGVASALSIAIIERDRVTQCAMPLVQRSTTRQNGVSSEPHRRAAFESSSAHA
jgi:hypothetical protein